MALLRLLSSPSQLHFSTTQFSSSSSSPALFPLHHQSIIPILSPSTVSLHISSLSPLLPIKPQKPYLYISHCSSLAHTPELQQDQEEQSEDESSRTRILAQNAPWTSTADDLRPLFEKYGTVMDIEVCTFKIFCFWYGEKCFNL